MDRLLAMQTFVRVVETGSFSAVAREQTSTQSAISKQVAANDYRFSALVMEIVKSKPFQMRDAEVAKP